MSLNSFFSNLLSPQIVSFAGGFLISFARCPLEIPKNVSRVVSSILLASIGLKGGMALVRDGICAGMLLSLGAAVIAAVLIPLWVFFALRKHFGVPNAAGVAASFGAVSSVTFLTGCTSLLQTETAFSGHMVAALVLMDFPAVCTGLFLARWFSEDTGSRGLRWREVPGLLRQILLNRSIFLLLAGLSLGAVLGGERAALLSPVLEKLFPVVLAIFLFDMGLIAGGRIGQLRTLGGRVVVFALAAPLLNAVLGAVLAWGTGMGRGDALLFVILCASASYIAAPAALRGALPEANPGVYLTVALVLVFPFNLVIGLPLYRHLVDLFLG